jgi:hypothetical protein
MTSKELQRVLKKVVDGTEIFIGKEKNEIGKIERHFINHKMQLIIIPKE